MKTFEALRTQIDAVDRQLLELLRERQGLVLEIGQLKIERGEPIVQPEREQRMYQARRAQATALELDGDYVEKLWRTIHEESCRLQERLRSGSAGP